MAVPAELYDSDEDFGGFSCGYEFEERVVPHPRPVENAAMLAGRLRAEREQTIIEIIRNGTLAELYEIYHDPPGFDVCAPLLHDWPPLLHAAFELRLDKITWLLAHDANANQCVDGKTPLIVALMPAERDEQQLFGVVNVLLNNNAVVNVADRTGRTPFMYALRNGYIQVVELLLNEVALEASDNEGNTALYYAIESGHVDLVRKLLRADVCTDIVNAGGATPREWALMCGLTEDVVNELFPVFVEYIVPSEYLVNNTAAALAPTVLGDGRVPPFFFDVREMLHGMHCAGLVQLFAEARIGLLQFLCLSDADLVRIGVPYPFQRNRIRRMLQRFHERGFSPRTLRTLSEPATTADLFDVIACQLKHLEITRCSIEYTQQMAAESPVPDQLDYGALREILVVIREKISRLRRIVARVDGLAEPPVQHIRPNRRLQEPPSKTMTWFERALAAIGIMASVVLVRRCRTNF